MVSDVMTRLHSDVNGEFCTGLQRLTGCIAAGGLAYLSPEPGLKHRGGISRTTSSAG